MYGVRPMTAADIPQVIEIELDAFPETRHPTDYRRELANKLARYLVLFETADGEEDQRLVGYAGLWFIVDEAHLLSIGVRTAYRRQGLGELLLLAGIDLALSRGAEMMTLEVRISNLGAQALYEKYGFVRVGRRRGYYPDNNEDAFLMTVQKLSAEPYQARLDALRTAHVQRLGPSLAVQPPA